MSSPLVSIVTPVYNGAEFLRECIESVRKQTYQNWEYIVLNNASTDETGAMAAEYASIDPRIRVETNETLLPIIANHNRAFSLISPKSKYVKVVSADDVIVPECLAKMVALAESHPTVGIIGSYQVSGGGDNWRKWRVRWDEIPFPSAMVSGAEICRRQLLEGIYVFGTPTSLMYRADLVRKWPEFYPNETPEADTSACYQCLTESDFGFVHQVLSYERIHGKQMSEASRNLNAYEPSRLSDLMVYGHHFLSAEEIETRKSEILKKYYAFLATATFRRKKANFWPYHKARISLASSGFSHRLFLQALLAKLSDLALNPKSTIEKALR